MIGKRQAEGGRLSGLLLLALFFLAGVILGQVLSGRVPDGAGSELGRYLSGYVRLEEGQAGSPALTAAGLYFRYPLLAFFLGFTSLGVALLPCLTVACGFFLSFSVCCFTAAFGPDGVLLALAVFGIRCMVTLPCYFLLAVPSWSASAALASLSFGWGRRTPPAVYGRPFWLRLGGCAATLLVGMWAELYLSPWFLQLVLERIFP